MNTTDTKINVRIDRDTKQQAKETLEALGLDISSGVKLFLKSVINTQSIPFEVRTANGYTIQQEQTIVDDRNEAHQNVKNGALPVYTSASAMIQDMGNWDDEGNYVRT